jgi:hypothetical protein
LWRHGHTGLFLIPFGAGGVTSADRARDTRRAISGDSKRGADKDGRRQTNRKGIEETNSKKIPRRSQDKGISLRALEKERERVGRIVVEKREKGEKGLTLTERDGGVL